MAHHLVIMESPAKAKTVQGYLGSTYKVVACVGHVRDLPKSSLGVDVDNHFEPHYINIRGKGELIKELRKYAKAADNIYLATDPDREGEAISWHLATVLGIPLSDAKRVTCNEITKTAFKKAMKQPRALDMDLVNSQQARRILDRIVGYKLSPYLWKTVRSGLSAGRVQSVATRIIVEREQEIKAFVPKESWSVTATLLTDDNKTFSARFWGNNSKIELLTEADAKVITDAVTGKSFLVTGQKKALKSRNPAAPFTTSTLQQEANRRLNFQSYRTMRIAQELYEGVSLGAEFGGTAGLITYMRTDSLRISEEAQATARSFIGKVYGEENLPSQPRIYKSRSGAQDAHEAIRPVNLELPPEKIKKALSADQYKLYKLIFDRFIASQMASAQIDTITMDCEAAGYVFKASGSSIRFPGFLSVYEESEDGKEDEKEGTLPDIPAGSALVCKKLLPEQHFSEPPQRFTEAALIKFLEEKGLGRPSTYATIISTICERGYVKREGKSLLPTELGEITTKLMIEHFPDVVDYRFTAQMEERLDSIENGVTNMEDVLQDFYTGFSGALDVAMASAEKETVTLPVEETDILCDKCGAKMVIKSGRFGKFAACPNYPTCKNTKPLAKDGKSLRPEKAPEILEGESCPNCGKQVVKRAGRYGEFISCVDYPGCKYTKAIQNELGVNCPDCGKPIAIRRGRFKSVFYSCTGYPECKFSTGDLPTGEKCPVCGGMLLRKKGKNLLVCRDKECGYSREVPDAGKDSGK